jgi:hypothetical protein
MSALADGLAWQSHHGRSGTDLDIEEWWRSTGQLATCTGHVAVAMLPGIAWLFILITRGFGSIPLLLLWFTAVPLVIASLAAFPWELGPRLLPVTTGPGIIGLAAGATLGVVGWLIGGLLNRLTHGLTSHAGIALFIVAFLLTVLPIELIGALWHGITNPYPDGLDNGPLIGVLGGVSIGVVLPSSRIGLIGGLAIGLTVGLTFFSNGWIRNLVAVVRNATRGQWPWRLRAFLDWGVRAGLLRRSGVAYQFRHRQLQEWLTSPDDGGPGEPEV